jgi:hypothetical protein
MIIGDRTWKPVTYAELDGVMGQRCNEVRDAANVIITAERKRADDIYDLLQRERTATAALKVAMDNVDDERKVTIQRLENEVVIARNERDFATKREGEANARIDKAVEVLRRAMPTSFIEDCRPFEELVEEAAEEVDRLADQAARVETLERVARKVAAKLESGISFDSPLAAELKRELAALSAPTAAEPAKMCGTKTNRIGECDETCCYCNPEPHPAPDAGQDATPHSIYLAACEVGSTEEQALQAVWDHAQNAVRVELERLTGELAAEAAAFKRVVWLEAELERCRRVVEAAQALMHRHDNMQGFPTVYWDRLRSALRALDAAGGKGGGK